MLCGVRFETERFYIFVGKMCSAGKIRKKKKTLTENSALIYIRPDFDSFMKTQVPIEVIFQNRQRNFSKFICV